MIRGFFTVTLLGPLTALAISMSASAAFADTVATAATEAPAPAPETTTVPAPPAPTPQLAGTTAGSAPAGTTPTSTTTASPVTTETTTVPPEVRTQRAQRPAVVVRGKGSHAEIRQPSKPATKGGTGANGKAVSPSVLTPPLPSTLGGSLSGVPSFFIDSFSIPPFLLPIYQAAGAAYGIPWQVLAAINEVETDYGRDLSLSTAGAEGWMQFLPSTWTRYGVDVNSDGFEDPYNPADAIFGAARYLKAAGGDTDIGKAIFAYNHSQAYVKSVFLRARLLGGTPPELLGAVTGLTEARFPVYAASHYGDAFPITEGTSPHTVAGTTIDSQDGAPVIAVQDGRIVQIEQSGPLGRSISLRDAYGNTYTYAELGTTATLYPVLEAAEGKSASATASIAARSTQAASGATRVFKAGSENVYLHPLGVGAQVIAGTVLGHVGPGLEPHIVFQIRPAGIGSPLIDPKPILDGWVKLQSSSVVKAKGRDPFAKISPTPGQALLESKTQLEQQIPRDHGIHLAACERRLIVDGRADRRVLAVLEFLSASGLKPSISSRSCAQAAAANRSPFAGEAATDDAIDISAIGGLPVTGSSGLAAVATGAVRKLVGLQGVMKPLQIASATHIPGAPHSVAVPGYAGLIHISFAPLGGGEAHAAGASRAGLTPAEWLKLVARLGQVPDPTVNSKPSPAAIPDHRSAAPSAAEGK
jgi:murein DD-endopeptidase MepM/ murein hydrolase activator NlpD